MADRLLVARLEMLVGWVSDARPCAHNASIERGWRGSPGAAAATTATAARGATPAPATETA